MKVAPHLTRLYVKTSRRYRKLISRLHRAETSEFQRKTFIHELRKLVRRLRNLQLQLKLAAATGTVVLMLHAGQAQAQVAPTSALGPFINQQRTHNPLREPLLTGDDPAITMVDFDGDGDADVVLAEYDWWYGSALRYFENQSSDGFPTYIELKDEKNPLQGIRSQTTGAGPAFADIDGDGDLDLFLGQSGWDSYTGTGGNGIEYFRNEDGVFTKQTGAWEEVTKAGNPFEGVVLGDNISPVFVDFDKDGDQDVIIGSYQWLGYPDYQRYIHYYQNNGSGTFTPVPATINTPIYAYGRLSPAVADMDQDGDYDIVLGAYNYGELIYLQQVAPGSFTPTEGEWDSVLKTGNPFDGFQVGQNASPAFVDFNNDGNLDLFVADESGYFPEKYSDRIINYYKNTGNDTFEEIKSFENPFTGVFVKRNASPVLLDVDGDQELDAIVGNKYNGSKPDPETGYYTPFYSMLAYYKKNEVQKFEKVADGSDPFEGHEVDGYFSPQFVDVDGDADLDIITGGSYGQVVFLRNDEGVYVNEIELSPFAGINVYYNSSARMADIDNDGDLDLFMTNGYGEFFFFRNDAGEFIQQSAEENPLYFLTDPASYRTPIITFTDLDHDGDLDVVFGSSSKYQQSGELVYYENTGSREVPLFDGMHTGIFPAVDPRSPQANFADYDGDGDLDSFVGVYDGTVAYFENQNPIVVTTVGATTTLYDSDGDPVIVDDAITLTDPDNDIIIQATITIEDFEAGEKLNFASQGNVSGVFDSGTGVLTLRGKATVAEYQELLRTVTFEVEPDASGRRNPGGKNLLIDKTIVFAVFDEDFTDPEIAPKSLQIFINDPPVMEAGSLALTAGGSAALDLKTLVSDPNGSADIDLASLSVTVQPASGATASIDANGLLTVDYAGLPFLGSEPLTIEVCDLDGACVQNTIIVTVTNTPPVISPEPVSTPSGQSKTVNLMLITSDIDNNLDPDGFAIVQQPESGAVATISVVSATEVNLLLDYDGITFHGTDELTIRACDKAAACTESLISVAVDVESTIVVFNAVAPNSSGDNRVMRITGLPESNRVSIFNRWGDKVFETENYQNPPGENSFRGMNNQGNALPSGTYFYTIEVPERKAITGYLTLKQ